MKAILYVGALFMTGAAVYGFVDYKKSSQDKEFRSLYHETSSSAGEVKLEAKPVAVVSSAAVAAPKEEGKKTVSHDKKAIKKIGSSASGGKASKKLRAKMFNTKMFSRGSLDERRLPVKEVKL